MAFVEPEFAYIAKEEIIRNVIKTHTVVLLLGWTGAGKTVSALKAVKGLWKPYYLNASGRDYADAQLHNADAIVIQNPEELPTSQSPDTVLIIDDFDGATDEIISGVRRMISGRLFQGKIIITAEAQPKFEELGLSVDAVVRMKDNTAQVLYTRLRDISI